jgi:membrane associated rhomboid family serine protease
MSFVYIILGITVLVSFLCFNNEDLFNKLKHNPYAEYRNKEYYRWLTSGFVHGDIMHLFINMFVFHEFGRYVESVYTSQYGVGIGGAIFTLIYFLIIIAANTYTYTKHKNWHGYSAVGASGGVAGILFIFILNNPWNMLGIMGIIPIPAIIFGGLYLWYESYAAKNIQDNVGHDAHFYGAIAGVALAIMTIKGVTSNFLNEITHNFPF